MLNTFLLNGAKDPFVLLFIRGTDIRGEHMLYLG